MVGGDENPGLVTPYSSDGTGGRKERRACLRCPELRWPGIEIDSTEACDWSAIGRGFLEQGVAWTERCAMLGRRGLAVGMVALTGLGLTLAMGAKRDGPEPDTTAIAKEQVGYAREALESLGRQVETGQRPPSDPEVRKWTRRLVEAQRAAGDAEAFRKASEDYIELLKKNVERAEFLFGVGKITPAELMDAKYELNEARLWLTREGPGK